MDYLNITGLKIATHIGIHAWEQKIEQNVLIDLSIPMEFKTCDDDIKSTLDYDQLCQLVTEYVASQSFQLIETIANQVAALIQDQFKIASLTVAVSKPQAVKNASDVRVIVSR